MAICERPPPAAADCTAGKGLIVTMDMARVTFSTASVGVPPPATSTSRTSETSSAAYFCNAASSPSAPASNPTAAAHPEMPHCAR